MRACNGICFLFHFLILFARMCSTFNIIPLNCLPRSSATRISNLCVCNKQHTAYYTILYTHKSTFHTPHSRFSFFLFFFSIYLPLLFSFLRHFVGNLCRIQRKWISMVNLLITYDVFIVIVVVEHHEKERRKSISST